jgi:hypothetical protein
MVFTQAEIMRREIFKNGGGEYSWKTRGLQDGYEELSEDNHP